jgi:hypothetical protein
VCVGFVCGLYFFFRCVGFYYTHIPGGGGSDEERSKGKRVTNLGKRVTNRETATAVAELPRQSPGMHINTGYIHINTAYIDCNSSCRAAAPKSRHAYIYITIRCISISNSAYIY